MQVKNRIVISPMQQYSAADDGIANDWHTTHLVKLAIGGAGLVFTEALATEPRARLTHADLGIWNDEQVEAFEADRRSDRAPRRGAWRATDPRRTQGQRPRPWNGYQPLSAADAARGDPPWLTVGPSALPANPGWHVPHALDAGEIRAIVDSFALAARRVLRAGFTAPQHPRRPRVPDPQLPVADLESARRRIRRRPRGTDALSARNRRSGARRMAG
jgi:2,4-dienoyl-CoA reductase-like NADH-dependent reductase (Old Yellow Enzyme family)